VALKHERWAGPLFPGHVCSVGYEVIDAIQANMCHGEGDIQGRPAVVDDEMADHIVECYRIDEVAGRRVNNEVVLSRSKGRAKSEIAAWVAVAEAFFPCRFDGWNADGQPVARPVTSPLVKCLATEESQAGNTFKTVAYIAGEWGQDEHPEIYGGVSGIRAYQSASAIYLPHGGEVRACTSGSASKDGGLESHVVVDESHLYVLQELKDMYATVARNLGKRYDADPWMHQTSTAYKPGQGSVFEDLLTAWRKGELEEAIYVNHREAKGKVDLDDKEHTLAQLNYVYGAAAGRIDMERKYRDMRNPRICADWATAARYYLNRPMSSKDVWIPVNIIERQARTEVAEPMFLDRKGFQEIDPKTPITIGFDGSLNEDSTILIGCRMSDGFLFPIGIWEKPAGLEGAGWEVPRAEVLAAARVAFDRYDVVRMYGDPHEWRTDLDDLGRELGEKRVIPWATTRDVAMAAALECLHTDLIKAVVCHSGDGVMAEHFGNTFVRMKGRLRLVRKENESSSRKIDSTVGATLAYEARADALAAGWKAEPPKKPSRVIVMR
jgi:phage terminase large subunit-like protein